MFDRYWFTVEATNEAGLVGNSSAASLVLVANEPAAPVVMAAVAHREMPTTALVVEVKLQANGGRNISSVTVQYALSSSFQDIAGTVELPVANLTMTWPKLGEAHAFLNLTGLDA